MNVLNSYGLHVLLSFLIVLSGVRASPPSDVVRGDIVDVILNDRSSFFYFDAEKYPTVRNELAIGVFDSGTGGLTVLDAIVNFDGYDNRTHVRSSSGDGVGDFCAESFVYLGDKANMPYGNYAAEGKADLLKEHIIKDVQFLLGDRYYLSGADRRYQSDKPRVKAVVIACNTATAFGKTEIERFLDRAGLNIKVIGVIDAGVAAALDYVGKAEDCGIAVMATAGTVGSRGYVKALKNQISERGHTGEIQVYQQAGIGLAGAIDGAGEYICAGATGLRRGYRGPARENADAAIDISIWDRYGFDYSDGGVLLVRDGDIIRDVQLNSVRNYISYHLVTLMEKIRRAPRAKKLRAIILGCTHYPFFAEVFRAELERLYDYREEGDYVYRAFMAERIELVDPAPNVAAELYEYLVLKGLFARSPVRKSRFYLSVPNLLNDNNIVDADGGFPYSYKYGREAGFIQEYVRRVPFGPECMTPEMLERLSEKMPVVYAMIGTGTPRE